MLDVKFLFKSKDITVTHRYFRITIRKTFHSLYKTTRSNTELLDSRVDLGLEFLRNLHQISRNNTGIPWHSSFSQYTTHTIGNSKRKLYLRMRTLARASIIDKFRPLSWKQL